MALGSLKRTKSAKITRHRSPLRRIRKYRIRSAEPRLRIQRSPEPRIQRYTLQHYDDGRLYWNSRTRSRTPPSDDDSRCSYRAPFRFELEPENIIEQFEVVKIVVGTVKLVSVPFQVFDIDWP